MVRFLLVVLRFKFTHLEVYTSSFQLINCKGYKNHLLTKLLDGSKKEFQMKNNILKAALASVILLNVTFFANAGLISGTHTTDDGKVVALQGLEWMSLDYTAGLSRSAVENGFTDRYGNTWAAGEWEYASRAQTETLLGSLWDQIYSGWSSGNGDGAMWFIDNLGGLGYDVGFGVNRIAGSDSAGAYTNRDYSSFFYGADGECTANAALSCTGKIYAADNFTAAHINSDNALTGALERGYTKNTGRLGYLHENSGLLAGIDSSNAAGQKTVNAATLGSLLVRTADVPEPSTLAIFALGLMGLASRRFKKQS
jgi:hypothetical protein